MSEEYSKYSPYFTTKKFGVFLDVLEHRAIPKNSTDVVFKINAVYQYRPDLLAHDLYGRAGLWWVFAMRNPNVIRDPIFDFRAGRSIYIPNGDSIKSALGV